MASYWFGDPMPQHCQDKDGGNRRLEKVGDDLDVNKQLSIAVPETGNKMSNYARISL